MENLAKQVKVLRIYALVLTLALIGLAIYTIAVSNRKELTAERINIVEKDGTVRMVISNREKQHPGAMDHKDLPKRDRPAGMIFFNDEGDEDGGLVYDGNKNGASMTYSFDQYKNDQIMQLKYEQEPNKNGNEKSYGLFIWDRDEQFTMSKRIALYDSLMALRDTNARNAGLEKMKAAGYTQKRMFVGKNTKGEVGIFLNDANGKPRLNIYVNKQNQPVIETLNDKGEVVATR